MLKRTTASLFLNWYVSREDALYLKLAIKKTGWGVGAASDLAQQAADALDDVDWDEFLGGSGVPGLSLVGSLAAKGIGIGAFGLRQVGVFIESTADDLLQGWSSPAVNGLSRWAQNGLPPRSLETVASAMTAPASGAAASVPAAGLAASGAGEEVPSVMAHTLGPGPRRGPHPSGMNVGAHHRSDATGIVGERGGTS